jgi:type IV pilus assembly protein PilW
MKGFSLIEFMICLLLSSLIILALTLTTVHHRANNAQQALELQLENNLSFAKNQLEQAIRGAGYAGCGSVDNLTVSGRPLSAISGTEHRLKMSFAEASSISLFKEMATSSADLIVKNNFKVGNPLIISDCASADIFVPSRLNANTIAHSAFQKAYSEKSTVSTWNEVVYEVLRTKRKDIKGEWIYALYSQHYNSNREEVAEHIVQMDITYAKTLNDFNRLGAPQAGTEIKMIRIKLKAARTFKGQPLEKELTFFITLRNRC